MTFITLIILSNTSFTQIIQPVIQKPTIICDPFTGILINPTPATVNPPFGSGNRTMRICINKCAFSTTSPPELIVFYSKTESALNNVTINPTASYGHGKAKFVKAIGGVLVYDYTFPHSGFTDLNGSGAEFKIIEIPSRDASKNSVNIFYRLAVKPVGSNTLDKNAATASFLMPDPITIGMVGDSYAAGEGAPLVTARTAGGALVLGLQTLDGANLSRMWNDNDSETSTDIPCHRSNNSGFAQAAAQIRLNNKKTAFSIKFVACSGAQTADLMSSQQVTHGETVSIQFDLIRTWLDNKGYSNLDILLMSVGGNDVGFADLIFDYVIVPFKDFNNDTDAQKKYTDANDERYPWNILAQNYDALQQNIGTRFSVLDFNVILTGGPSPCKGPVGNPFCGEEFALGATQVPGNCWGILEEDDRPAEWKDIHNIIASKLNSTMTEAATRNKWTFVEMRDRAGDHGISNCASPYVNTIGKSQSNQGDVFGTVHPNANGYVQMYKAPVVSALQARIDAINAFWKGFSTDCAADAKAAAIEAAKEKAKARARAAASSARLKSYSETYLQFRQKKFGALFNQSIGDYHDKIKSGTWQLPPPDINLNITNQLKNIDFNDIFQK